MLLTLSKNDKKARILILTFSAIVFIAVTVLEQVTIPVDLGFDPHILAALNAMINSIVAVLLVVALVAAKRKNIQLHRNIMLTAIVLSIVFLVNYILYHLFAGSTWYGDVDGNGVVSEIEKAQAGSMRYVYFFILGTHILLAGISLPYILFAAYRALINENAAHRKVAKVAWPMWFYVAITGPIVYLMISAYH